MHKRILQNLVQLFFCSFACQREQKSVVSTRCVHLLEVTTDYWEGGGYAQDSLLEVYIEYDLLNATDPGYNAAFKIPDFKSFLLDLGCQFPTAQSGCAAQIDS